MRLAGPGFVAGPHFAAVPDVAACVQARVRVHQLAPRPAGGHPNVVFVTRHWREVEHHREHVVGVTRPPHEREHAVFVVM